MEIPQDYTEKFQFTDKPQFEFQALCQELEPIYGKRVWTLPYKVGFTEQKIRDAAKIAKEQGIEKLSYLIGIVRNLK